MFEDFFERKRILVTGVAGVKGSWLALKLLEAGSTVIGIDSRYPETNSNFQASGLARAIEFVKGDITDFPFIERVMQRCDGVFHLAGIALVGEANRAPLQAYRVNTLGTATVLDSMLKVDTVRYGVFVTTDKVYQPRQDGEPWAETAPLMANGPYCISKACAEYVIADYYRNYMQKAGKCLGVARAGNVLVGGDFNSSRVTNGAGRLFVDCFEALMENRSPEIFTPLYSRPYLYGLDVISGYMLLMSCSDRPDVNGEAFNFGPDEEHGTRNGEIATKICELWGGGAEWHSGQLREEPFQQQILTSTKAKDRLGWRPAYKLCDTLQDTTAWYKEWTKRGRLEGEGSMMEFDISLSRKHQDVAKQRGIPWAYKKSMSAQLEQH